MSVLPEGEKQEDHAIPSGGLDYQPAHELGMEREGNI